MNTHLAHRWMAYGLMVLALVALLTVRARGVLGAEDCVGKPYGYPGCPTRTVTTAQVSSLCGNGQVDDAEECDEGTYYNGAQGRPCTTQCTLRVCGDGHFDADLGEECEPEEEEVYVMDPETGKLTTERRFVGASCGTYCTAPVYDQDGQGKGGCQRKFLAACVSSASSTFSTASAIGSEGTSSVGNLSVGIVGSTTMCGNGTVEAGEQCDDGARNSDARPDTCRRDCTLPTCGDAIVDKGEECDDGNRIANDGCMNDCRMGRCDNGLVEWGEQCDDGVRNSDSKPDACRLACTVSRCGDGVVDRGEECDDGNKISVDTCTNECRAARCGDAIVQSGEQCDEGPRNSDARPNACRLTCMMSRCGDAVVDKGEECDDGNQVNADSCTNECRRSQCGDAIVQAGEQCDDGVRNSDTKSNACRLDCQNHRCGDSIIDRGEECDGGAACTNECKSLHAAGAETGSGAKTLIDVLVAAVGGLLTTLAFVFRKKIFPYLTMLFTPKKLSIDDIPLSDIENPFHKW